MDVAGRPSESTSLLKLIAGLLAVIAIEQAVQIVTRVLADYSPNRWQYTIDSPSDDKLDARLQQLGAGGWEMVSARRATGQGSTAASYEMIFRRPARDTYLDLPQPK